MSSTTEPYVFERTVADLKQGVETATAAHTEASEKAMKAAKDMAVFSQGTLEALTQASQTLAAGSQDLFRQMAESGRSAFAETLSGFRAIMTAKTPKERLELHANFVRTSALWAVSESSRFANAGIELGEKVSAPLTARAIVAAETLSSAKL